MVHITDSIINLRYFWIDWKHQNLYYFNIKVSSIFVQCIMYVEAIVQVGWDLCVLATSLHSVHTYGTFGMWGSLLAGGEAVVARGRVQVGTWSQCSQCSPMILLSAGRGADSGGHLVQAGRHAGLALRGHGCQRGGGRHHTPGGHTVSRYRL